MYDLVIIFLGVILAYILVQLSSIKDHPYQALFAGFSLLALLIIGKIFYIIIDIFRDWLS